MNKYNGNLQTAESALREALDVAKWGYANYEERKVLAAALGLVAELSRRARSGDHPQWGTIADTERARRLEEAAREVFSGV